MSCKISVISLIYILLIKREMTCCAMLFLEANQCEALFIVKVRGTR